MYRIILILSITLFAAPLFADEAADKAEFKKLYAEFNDLYANSEKIDPIIEVAEKLYKLTPKAYGKNHMNYAVVTYNLASLYDEKGANSDTSDEKTALRFYEEYFGILGRLDQPKDRNYIQQYLQYVLSDYNVNKLKTSRRLSDRLLKTVEYSELSEVETATIEYTIARARIKAGKIKTAEKQLENALMYFEKDVNKNKSTIGEIEYWLAMVNMSKIKNENAIENLEIVLKLYDGSIPDPNGFALNSHLNLYKLSFIVGDYDACDKHFDNFAKLDKSIKFAKTDYDDPSDILPIVRESPEYPSRAAENGFEGFALVSFTVNKTGKTENVRALLSSHEMFEKTSIRAAMKYKYRPRTVNGQPVNVDNVTVRVEYRLAS